MQYAALYIHAGRAFDQPDFLRASSKELLKRGRARVEQGGADGIAPPEACRVMLLWGLAYSARFLGVRQEPSAKRQ